MGARIVEKVRELNKVTMNKAIATMALSLAASLDVSAQTKEILSLKGSEGKLYAELQKPATKAERLPLVIICHGFTGNCNTDFMTEECLICDAI